jgi:imidazolonepropionase-like amidohydrolase
MLFALAVSVSARAGDELIQRVNVFDGKLLLVNQSVLIRDGRIAQVASSIDAAGAEIISGKGRTLIPGLIDAHTHVRSALDLEKALAFGVTTVLSLNMDPALAARLKKPAPDRADLLSAGSAATVPDGHGTEFGWRVPTLTAPNQAQAWVDARIAEGSDFIKIMYEYGGEHGRSARPSLDPETLSALIRAAHARGKLAIVHIHTAEQALGAIVAGADGLAHLYLSGAEEITPQVVEQAARHRVFVIPTLTLLQSVCGQMPGKQVLEDARLRRFVLDDDLEPLGRAISKEPATECGRPSTVTAQLVAAKVPILAGTDEPKPGVVIGASLHVELTALVSAGLDPIDALAAATSVAAKAFHLNDRGRVAPGMRADLVLVDGNPAVDISTTRNIVSVWKGGVRFDRDAWLAARQSLQDAHERSFARTSGNPAGTAPANCSRTLESAVDSNRDGVL